MPSVPAHVQEISINWISREAWVVARGYYILGICALPLMFMLSSIVRDLPRFEAAKLVSPELWVWAGIYALGARMAITCRAPFCKRCLGGFLAWQTLMLLAAGAVYGPHIHINFVNLAQIDWEPALALSLLLLALALMLYWVVFAPALAAIRLLATRLPPDDLPLPTMMAALEQTSTRPPALPVALTRLAIRAQALKAIAYLALLGALVVALWIIGQLDPDRGDLLAFLPGGVLEFSLAMVFILLLRRSKRLAAVYAIEQLKHDPRAPVLYLRSFQDDQVLRTDFFVLIGSRGGAGAQAWRRFIIRHGWGRLEEWLAGAVRGVGPFVAIGAPTEPLPQLGAARAYFSDDTWQNAIIRWVDSAGLIINVVGPTKWIRWELDTIVERDAVTKLIILLPPGGTDERAARWQNVTSALQRTRWGSSLFMVDSEAVSAIGFLDDGGISIVTGGKRRPLDYLLAFRLVLYQLKKSARVNRRAFY
jgi:hypothetical protein